MTGRAGGERMVQFPSDWALLRLTQQKLCNMLVSRPGLVQGKQLQ